MLHGSSRAARQAAAACLFVLTSILSVCGALAQSLPTVRTTFVARDAGEPSPCFEFACFNRASYDGNTLAAIGATFPAVYVFARIPAGPWYRHAILQNRLPPLPDYQNAIYQYPLAVVGDDIFVTSHRDGLTTAPALCETHVLTRTGVDTRWRIKQIINVCATQFAKDGGRILFATSAGPMPIFARGADGLYAEEGRLFPPSTGFFDVTKSLALQSWTVVIGTPLANEGVGAAYIYQRRGGQWLLMQTLVPPNGATGTRFGTAVAATEYNVAISASGAVNHSGTGQGLVYIYTGVGDQWFVSQEIAEPPGTTNSFGTALALRGRRLVVSSDNTYPFATGPFVYLFERGLRESAWLPRAQLQTGNGLSIDLSGNTAMVDVKGLRFGTFPSIVVLPPLREPDVPQ